MGRADPFERYWLDLNLGSSSSAGEDASIGRADDGISFGGRGEKIPIARRAVQPGRDPATLESARRFGSFIYSLAASTATA